MEPDMIRVGQATVNGHLHIEPPDKPHWRIHADRALVVKLPFEYRAPPKEWDACSIELRTRLNGVEQSNEWHEHTKGWLPPEELGFISTHYDELEPGAHELEFEVRLLRHHGPRGHPELDHEEHLEQRGSIHLDVVA